MIKPDTQAGRILAHLQTGKTLDRLTALIDLGVFELSARIWQLEKEGYSIKKEPKIIKNRWNEKQRVVEYSLELQNV
jgi:hypothetical protein